MANANGNVKRKLSEEGEDKEDDMKKVKSETCKEAGTLLFSGLSDYTQRNVNVKDKYLPGTLKWSPHRFESLEGIRIRDVSTHPVAYFFLAIDDSGKVYAWGFNKRGQLGLNDNLNRRNPTLMKTMDEHNVVAVATGRQHCLLLTDTGDVYSCGDNQCGQLGINKKTIESINVPQKIDYNGPAITQIACGSDYSLILTISGDIYSFGSPEYGQLGHGSNCLEITGKGEVFNCTYKPKVIMRFIEVDDNIVIPHKHPTIVHIAAGINHCVAIDDQQRLYTWGFGGYGRLGHNNTKDEWVPRMMRCWYRITGRADGGVTRVFAGGWFNFVTTIIDKCAYMFGQFHNTAEANMYPKIVRDLEGWNIRHLVCSRYGYIVCADDSVIASCPYMPYGMLGMGEKRKTCIPPIIVTTLEDVYCLRAGVGYMHSCYIVRDQTAKDKTRIEKFPTMMFDDTQGTKLVETVSVGNKAKGKGKKKK